MTDYPKPDWVRELEEMAEKITKEGKWEPKPKVETYDEYLNRRFKAGELKTHEDWDKARDEYWSNRFPQPKKLSPSEKTAEAFDKIKELNEKMPESLKQKFQEAMQGKGNDKQPTPSVKPNWDEIEAFEAETLRNLNQNKMKAPEMVEPKGLSFNKTPSFDQVSKRSVTLTDQSDKTGGLFGIKS